MSPAFDDLSFRQLLTRSSEGRARRSGDAESANALDEAINSVIPEVRPTRKKSFLDHGLSLTYGNKYQLGNNTLGLIGTLSFKQDYQNLVNYREGNWEILDITSSNLRNNGDFVANRSVENPTLSGLVGAAYRIGENTEFNLTAMYNHGAEKISRTIEGERPDNLFSSSATPGVPVEFCGAGDRQFPTGWRAQPSYTQ